MGDISEMRGLIVCVTFIATAITLILLIPSAFYPTTGGTQYVNPASGSYRDILAWNESYHYNLTGNYLTGSYPNFTHARDKTEYQAQIGGWTFIFEETWFHSWYMDGTTNVTIDDFVLQFKTCDTFIGTPYNIEEFDWYNEAGTDSTSVQYVYETTTAILGFEYYGNHKVLTIEQLDLDARLGGNSTGNYTYSPQTLYTLRNSKTSIHVILYYNTTLYNAPSSAYQGLESPTHVCGLTLAFSQDFSERASQLNAWTLISGFLFFQLIPDLPVAISILIEVPIWIAEAYLIFIFVLRVIGAVFGGGGA